MCFPWRRDVFIGAASQAMFSFQNPNHQTVGPVPTEELCRLIAAGTVTRHTLVRREGTDFWQPAESFEEFKESFASPTTPPADPVTRRPDGSIDVASEVSPGRPGDAAKTSGKSDARSDAPSTGTGSSGEPPRDGSGRFFMIGGDGREYGPFDATQLREWIRQRRADGRTRIRREDGGEFAPLSAWPEFADALGGSPNAQQKSAAPPPLDSAKAEKMATEIIGRGINLSIGSCFSRSWKLYTQHFGILTGTTALVLLILTALHSIPGAGNVAAIALGGVLAAGLSVVFLKTIRGQTAEVGDVFLGLSRCCVPLLLASVIVFILVTAGTLLCFLPGIYLAVAWMFVYTLVIEHSIDFWPAMELSRKVVHERWWELFALALGASLLFFLGALLMVVGVFFTTPIAFGALMYAYEDIFGVAKN